MFLFSPSVYARGNNGNAANYFTNTEIYNDTPMANTITYHRVRLEAVSKINYIISRLGKGEMFIALDNFHLHRLFYIPC